MDVDDLDYKLLRELDMKSKNGYSVLVSSDKAMSMRGIDYRAPTNGIKLIIDERFSNKRELLQAALRVGRQGDPCERGFIVKQGVSNIDGLVDNDKLRAYRAGLFSFIRQKTEIVI